MKFKKYFKKRFLKNNLQYRSNDLQFGYYGLKALNQGCLTPKHIESGRKSINQVLKRSGKIWIRVFPTLPLTKKPVEVRMGKGKGGVSTTICHIKPGSVIYEINTSNRNKALEALKNASLKLPLAMKLISI